ncbi:MAG TPA: hypothetical protein VEB64_03010 [Azospirillaceae bacterium]|nr:hypothetical protein [Azospirillaceae bacterium]
MNTVSIAAQLPSEKERRAIERRAERDRALYLAALCRKAVGVFVGSLRD